MARTGRGAGRASALRLPYFGEQAAEMLAGTQHIVLISTQAPVTFFAYPGKPYWLTPDGCALHTLVERNGDIDAALDALGQAVGIAAVKADLQASERAALPSGELNPRAFAATLSHLFPDNAIVVDEGGTSGAPSVAATRRAPPHDWCS